MTLALLLLEQKEQGGASGGKNNGADGSVSTFAKATGSGNFTTVQGNGGVGGENGETKALIKVEMVVLHLVEI